VSGDQWDAARRAASLPPVQVGLLGKAIETSRHAVFVSNQSGDLILAVNAAACELLGYSREELLQTTPSAYTARSEAELRETYEQLKEPGSTIRGVGRLRRQDGEIVTIGYWGSWVKVAGVDYYLTVTDRLAARASHRGLVTRAESAARSIEGRERQPHLPETAALAIELQLFARLLHPG
jgi:PAS domain S-box-containing protein